MNCEEVKKELALRLVGLGDAGKSAGIEAHVKECPACAGTLEKAITAEKTMEAERTAGGADFEKAWRGIAARSFERKERRPLPTFGRRWALAGGIIVVFILGGLAGRIFLFGPKKAEAPAATFADMSPETAWRGYADRLELLLVDIGNRAEVERPADYVRREKALVEHILAETRSLKSLLVNQEDDGRLSLLREAEALLVKIAKARPGDLNSERSIARIVRESPLKAQLRAVGSPEMIH